MRTPATSFEEVGKPVEAYARDILNSVFCLLSSPQTNATEPSAR
jgi:hypothetical protein